MHLALVSTRKRLSLSGICEDYGSAIFISLVSLLEMMGEKYHFIAFIVVPERYVPFMGVCHIPISWVLEAVERLMRLYLETSSRSSPISYQALLSRTFLRPLGLEREKCSTEPDSDWYRLVKADLFNQSSTAPWIRDSRTAILDILEKVADLPYTYDTRETLLRRRTDEVPEQQRSNLPRDEVFRANFVEVPTQTLALMINVSAICSSRLLLLMSS